MEMKQQSALGLKGWVDGSDDGGMKGSQEKLLGL